MIKNTGNSFSLTSSFIFSLTSPFALPTQSANLHLNAISRSIRPVGQQSYKSGREVYDLSSCFLDDEVMNL
ncbi:hypothetical protein, partial [Hoylesella pleuritidis]|uniref:hypothetical protein n=1 Tax=Hoylesella pleuritidis TaxID=407975 RepID=UPI0028D2B6BA